MKKALGIIAVNFVLLLILLIAAEWIFRLKGYRPGLIIAHHYFYEVDTLIQYKDYVADENGITKINSEAGKLVAQHIAENTTAKENDFGDIKTLIDDFRKLNNKELTGPFPEFIYSLREKSPEILTEDEKAYLDYCFSPVNTDGFRSIKFKDYSTSKTKVLLLGDSHTWGGNALPVFNCFADVLSAKGYLVFNTGIVATDPVQYNLVAQKYIPLIKPDAVVVTFCLNNDRLNFRRKAEPFHPLIYSTNAGNIAAAPMGEFFKNVQDAYDFLQSEFFIPNQDTNLFNRICASTVITTKIWLVLRNNGAIVPEREKKYADYYLQVEALKSDRPVSEEYLENIQSVCKENNSKFIVVAVPVADNIYPDLNKDYPGLFQNITPFIPPGMTINDYYDTGFDIGHYNNEGHRKYADFLEHLIDSVLAN